MVDHVYDAQVVVHAEQIACVPVALIALDLTAVVVTHRTSDALSGSAAAVVRTPDGCVLDGGFTCRSRRPLGIAETAEKHERQRQAEGRRSIGNEASMVLSITVGRAGHPFP